MFESNAESPREAESPLRDAVVLRHPRVSDGGQLWELVRRGGVLDENSRYAYLLVCRYFATTSAVAVHGERVLGFVTGFRPPDERDALFVWQVGVAPQWRGQGIAKQLLKFLLDAQQPAANQLLATVTPGNQASRALFQSVAQSRGAPLTVEAGFRTADLGPAASEDEELLRIGPLG